MARSGFKARSGSRGWALAAAISDAAFVQAAAPAPQQVGPATPCADLPTDSPGSCSGEPLDFRAQRRGDIRAIADLPAARVGQPYHFAIIRGGVPAYVYDQEFGLPPGLSVSAAGVLTGTPTHSGDYHLHLEAHDQASPLNLVRGDWSIHVVEPRRPPPPKPPAPPPPTHPAPTPPAPTGHPGEFITYSLGQKDLADLDAQKPAAAAPPPAKPLELAGGPPAKAAQATAQSAPPAPAPPPPLTPLLAPMVNQQYPQESLFVRAVNYRLGPQAGLFKARMADIIAKARKPQSYAAAPPLHWVAAPGCGCVRPLPADHVRTIYGFFPFWRSTDKPPPIDFSLFDRIGFLGVQLRDDGDWIQPGDDATGSRQWWRDTSSFARAAQAHGAQLDLILERSDWSFLKSLNPRQLQTLYVTAARRAVDRADTPLTDSGAFFRGFLWGMWPRPQQVFDGITVMFTPPPSSDADEKAAFESFFNQFMLELIHDMQLTKRPYALNIVMTDEAFCRPGPGQPPCDPSAFSPAKLMTYKHKAEPAKRTPRLSREEAQYYQGTTPITVRFIVILDEFTGDTKKTVRRNIDLLEDAADAPLEGKMHMNDFEGPARTTFLHSIIPVVFEPAGQPAQPTAAANTAFDQDKMRLNYDLAYFKENFGGVGVAPIPMVGADAGADIDTALRGAFLGPGPKLLGFRMNYVCSTLIRLLWQLNAVLIVVGFLFYWLTDAGSKARRIILYGLFGLLVISLVLGFGLLELDPALNAIKTGNAILYFLVAVVAAVGIWFGSKPRFREP